MSTPKLNLPKISGNMTADVVRDLNALADAVDANAAKATELASHKADTAHVPYGTASGTNAKTISLDPAPTALAEGLALSFKNTTANTGAVTLNVNSLGAKSIVKSGGTALSSGNLKAGGVYTVRYDGVNFILQGEGGEYGTATAPDVLSGKTIGTEDGIVSGTMTNRGAMTITPRSTEQIIPAGYHNGSGKVVGDSNLVSSNIVSGSSIFGVTGSASNIKRIQKGTTDILNTSFSKTVNISAVDLTNSILIFSFSTNSNPTVDWLAIKGVFNSNTQLKFSRTKQYRDIRISWTVVEFNNVKSLQRGEYAFTHNISEEAIASVPISNVNVGKALVFFSFDSDSSSFDAHQMALSCSLNATNIEFKGYWNNNNLPKPHTKNISWQVIEFN